VHRSGCTLRAVGARHSWSPLVPSDGYLLDTRQLNRCLEQTDESIHVEAGVRARELNDYLARRGRMVRSLPIYEGMTVGGMVSTGSHGSGLTDGSLSDEIIEMTIVRADGEIVRVTDADLQTWRAARISLGMLGIIYSVKLKCRPAANMRAQDIIVPLDEGLAQMEQLARENEHLSAYSIPYTGRMWFYIANRTEESVDYGRRQRMQEHLRQYIWMGSMARLIGVCTRTWSPSTQHLLRVGRGMLRNTNAVRTSRDTFHYLTTFPHLVDSEYVIPLERAQEAYRCLLDLIAQFQRKRIFPINLALHARFIGGSDAFLSPTGGLPSVCIEAASTQTQQETEPFYREWGDFMIKEFDARPHWGKLFYNLPLIREQYGGSLIAFDSVRQRFDPEGYFLNPTLRELLGRSS
jgi:L-gulono-1,4-lactone dehydrogenase